MLEMLPRVFAVGIVRECGGDGKPKIAQAKSRVGLSYSDFSYPALKRKFYFE
jgi:hypothetical protein